MRRICWEGRLRCRAVVCSSEMRFWSLPNRGGLIEICLHLIGQKVSMIATPDRPSLHILTYRLAPRSTIGIDSNGIEQSISVPCGRRKWAMSLHFVQNDSDHTPRWQDQFESVNQRDLSVQIILSVALGLSAFIAFCVYLTNAFLILQC